MKGWRTIAFGALMAIVPAFLTYVGGVDWTSLGVSPGVAALIGGAIVALRMATSTPIGKSG